jgi:TP901 family phage tail tape measure protein
LADVGSLAIRLSLDDAEFNQSMSQVNRNLKTLGGEMGIIRNKGKDWGSSLQGLSEKQKVLSNILSQQEAKVRAAAEKHRQLAEEHGEGSVKAEKQAAALNKLISQYTRTETELNDVTQALNRQQREADQAANVWNRLGSQARQAGSVMSSVGSSMRSTGQTMSTSITLPIVGLGAATVKTAADFEESMDKVSAISGATGTDFENLEKQAKDLGATTKFSASEAAEGMQFLGMAGFDTKEIMAAMPGLLDLAAAGALDLGRAADIASNIMSGFSIDASKAGHVSDVLAKASASANTNVEQLGTAMQYLAPVSNALGWSLEEATSAVMALSDAGLQGEKAGAAFSTSLTRLTSPSKEAAGVMKQLGLEFFDAQGNMKSMPDVIREVEKGTKGLTNEQKAAALSTIFGQEAYKAWAVLLEKGSGALAENTQMLEKADGAAKKMADTMNDNTKGSFKEMLSAMEGLAIELGDVLLPIMNEGIAKVTEWTRKFADLSPATQKTILGVAGLAAAIGPLLMVTGSIATGLGGLVTLFGTVSGAIGVVTTGAAAATPAVGGLAAVITTMTGPVGIAIAGLAALGVGAVLLANEMKKPTFEVELFSDKVSESTQKAIGSYMELNDQATASLNNLSWGQKVVTQEMADSIVATFDEMGNRILTEMKKDYEEQLIATQEFFTRSSVLSAEEEEKAIQQLIKTQEEKVVSIQDGQKRIQEILEKAVEERRDTTETEKAIINAIREKMEAEAIKVMTESQAEQKAIYERMKAEASEITAQQAAEVVKQSVKQKDEVVKEAEDQYNKSIAAIIMLRDEAGEITEEQADQMIREATKQKDEVVARAEEMHEKVVTEAKGQAREHVAEVNWETGEIMTKWEQLMKASGTIWGIIGRNIKEELTDIGVQIAVKMGTAKVNFENKLDDMRVGVALKLAQIKGKFEEFKNDVIGFFTNMVLKIPTPSMPKLPHFSLNTSSKEIMGKTITYPTGFDVDWYDKGGIFTGPQIIGVGEKRPEFVGALDDLRHIVRDEFNKSGSSGDSIGTINIVIPAKDIKEFKDVTDFFKRMPQQARKHGEKLPNYMQINMGRG